MSSSFRINKNTSQELTLQEGGETLVRFIIILTALICQSEEGKPTF
jgi:hypothetical protein